MAQSVDRRTLDFGSGRDQGREIEPLCWALHRAWSLLKTLSVHLPFAPRPIHVLSL